MEKLKTYTKSEILEIKKDLNEGWGEQALLLAGFIPVIGEVADIALIIKYVKEKRYIEAGLMLIALIPTVGDFIVKPFLTAGRGVKGAFSNTTNLMKWLSSDAKAMEMYKKTGKYFSNPKINQLIGDISQKSPKIANELKNTQNLHKGIIAKLETQGPGKTFKQSFQRKALEKYLIKTGGKEPSTFLSYWWNVVYKGKRMRKALIKRILLGSNLLGHLGIYNIEDLENKMSNNKDAEELLQDPKFNQFYNQVTTENEQQSLTSDEGGVTSLLKGTTGFIGINALKFLAKFI